MPVRISLFNAERVDGSVTSVDEAVRLTGLHDLSVDLSSVLSGNVKLPAELTDEAHSECQDHLPADVDHTIA